MNELTAEDLLERLSATGWRIKIAHTPGRKRWTVTVHQEHPGIRENPYQSVRWRRCSASGATLHKALSNLDAKTGHARHWTDQKRLGWRGVGQKFYDHEFN